jgi:hypothetical protein
MERDLASNALCVGSNHTLHSIILNFPSYRSLKLRAASENWPWQGLFRRI